jgi:hypothetical protein
MPPQDQFAAIAQQPHRSTRPALLPIPPLRLPERRLECDHSDHLGAPGPAARLRTDADLRARMTELRQHYAPFLQDRTPALPRPRPRLDLREFLFRFETAEDRLDASRPNTDAGDWEAVTLPHYRGPVGRWAAYYRTQLAADAALFDLGRVYLVFRGVDYRCQVFMNGVFLGSHEGFFAPFEFDVTPTLRPGENTLLVRVENDFPTIGIDSWSDQEIDGDKLYAATGSGWDEPGVGWVHCPPGAGIPQPVFLEARAPLFVSDVWVRPDIDQECAEAWVEVTNACATNQPAALRLSIYPRNFNGQAVEGLEIEVPPAGPGPNLYRVLLNMTDYRLWSQQTPYLYTLRAEIAPLESAAAPLENVAKPGSQPDWKDAAFGMRKFHMDTGQEPKGTLLLNNQPVFLRGCNTMGFEQRSIMKHTPEQLIEDVLLLKAGHFNYLRITQRPVQSEVYEILDALGMLHQCDLPLFGYLRYNQFAEAVRQAGEMERLIRRHPSAVLVTFINEPFALQPGTRHHARMLDRPALEGFFAAATAAILANNPDRVVKTVDGDYDPPAPGLPDEHCYCLWYNNHGLPIGQLHNGWLLPLKPGWKGGCGEYGIEGLDAWETMQAAYPKDWLPSAPEETWNPNRIYKAQTYFMHIKFFDPEDTLAGWVRASQSHQARGLRLMTEAFRRRADVMVSTVVHLGIDAWPAGWLKSVVSVDRRPKPAFFAMADAYTPLAVNLRTDRHQVYGGERVNVEAWVMNDDPTAPQGMQLVWWVEQDGKVLFSQRAAAQVPHSGSRFQGFIDWQAPTVAMRTPVSLNLALVDASGQTLHDHQVWLEIFPAPDLAPLRGMRAGILGQQGQRAWKLAESLGMQPVPFHAADTPPLVIADQPAAVEAVEVALTRYLEQGGRVLCLEQSAPAGRWQVAGRPVDWAELDQCFFASRKTGHPAIAALQPFDLAYWYAPLEKRIAPTFRSVYHASDLQPIVFSASVVAPGTPLARPDFCPVAAELPVGQGKVIFNQLEVCDRVPSEPLAMEYITGVVKYLCG